MWDKIQWHITRTRHEWLLKIVPKRIKSKYLYHVFVWHLVFVMKVSDKFRLNMALSKLLGFKKVPDKHFKVNKLCVVVSFVFRSPLALRYLWANIMFHVKINNKRDKCSLLHGYRKSNHRARICKWYLERDWKNWKDWHSCITRECVTMCDPGTCFLTKKNRNACIFFKVKFHRLRLNFFATVGLKWNFVRVALNLRLRVIAYANAEARICKLPVTLRAK